VEAGLSGRPQTRPASLFLVPPLGLADISVPLFHLPRSALSHSQNNGQRLGNGSLAVGEGREGMAPEGATVLHVAQAVKLRGGVRFLARPAERVENAAHDSSELLPRRALAVVERRGHPDRPGLAEQFCLLRLKLFFGQDPLVSELGELLELIGHIDGDRRGAGK
jgi:hypothetical protein